MAETHDGTGAEIEPADGLWPGLLDAAPGPEAGGECNGLGENGRERAKLAGTDDVAVAEQAAPQPASAASSRVKPRSGWLVAGRLMPESGARSCPKAAARQGAW